MRLNHWIDTWKMSTLPYLLILRYYTHKDGIREWFYIAAHGSYGILWWLKEFVAPDRQFQIELTARMALMSSIYLLNYLIAPTVMMLTDSSAMTGSELMFWFIMYTIGIFLHFGSDIQKYYILQNKKRLIRDGFFSRLVHPNYMGEAFIYMSFCGISGVIWSYLILSFQICICWLPNMMDKEASLSRYPEWKDYRSKCIF